jgi:hypothetical protein
LDDGLVSHFIRGYFDGDGGISIAKNQLYKSSAGFAGNYDFLSELQLILIDKCNINKTKISKNANIFSLVVSGRFQLSRFLKYIYQDANIFLQRKFDKMQTLIKLNIVNLKDSNIN